MWVLLVEVMTHKRHIQINEGGTSTYVYKLITQSPNTLQKSTSYTILTHATPYIFI